MDNPFDRTANAIGQPFAHNGTIYDLHDPDPGTPSRTLEGGTLEQAAFAANVARCCDGDNHRAQRTLPDRYTATLEDAAYWYSRSNKE